ncbi:MAG: TRAP transporter large permease [Rhizobiaceae bacterium]
MATAPAILFLCLIAAALLSGFPVALALIATSLAFALAASVLGVFDFTLLYAIPPRIFGVLTNPVLIAVPLFVFMGMVLEKSRMAEDMFAAASNLFNRRAGGLLASVTMVGVLMAASTGIVGASVVTLGLLGLPALLKAGVKPSLASGSVAAAGTLGQIIPPAVVLIVLGDQMSNAYQKAQTDSGNFAPDTVSVTDLFAGALVPGILLAGLFVIYQLFVLRCDATSDEIDAGGAESGRGLAALLAPLLLIVAVLGSILAGIATPTEAASIGAVLALFLAFLRNRSFEFLNRALTESVHLVSMIFLIVIAASIFSLIFRVLGGDELVASFLGWLPGGTYGALIGVMLLLFLLGFFLEFLEITYMVVPLLAPVLLALPMTDGSAMSPVWLGVLIAINLQTSFLTPPFGVSLFYLRSVAPHEVSTNMIYRGVAPFVLLQLLALALVLVFPQLATWLPAALFGS